MELLIPCAFGLEAVVKRQLKALGYDKAPAHNGRIALEGDWSDVARLNVFLRSGERVLLRLAAFPARTFDELFDGTYALRWEELLPPRAKIRIDGKSVESRLGAIKASGGIVKKAIVKRLLERRHIASARLDESGPRCTVGVSIEKDEATLTLDTSGDGLHKRGYRTLAYPAPLKETTAAALIDLTYYRADKPFADLFCGSGTLPIEAAMKSLHIAPGLKRSFDFERWNIAPSTASTRAREEANDAIVRRRLDLYGADCSKEAIEIARFHARRAGVADAITFRVADVSAFTATEPYGILLSNPPYGERMSDEISLRPVYRAFGKVFRALPDWSAYFLSALQNADRWFGMRAEKAKPLKNAHLDCRFYSFPGKPPEKTNE